MALIAIELKETKALVASARVSGKRLQVQQLFTVELDGDDASAAEQLKLALGKEGLARSEAIVVVGRSEIEMRELVVPPAPDSELPDMVRFIARNEFASFNDSWSLDFVPLSDDANQSRTVLAAAISPELKTQIGKLTESAGLKVRNIVLRPYAAIALLQDSLVDGQCRLVIDPDGDQVDLSIVDGTQLVGARTVRIAANCDPAQYAESLVSEIRRTLASSKKMLGERTVSGVVIIGNDDQHQSLEDNLKSELGLDVECVSPLSRISTKSNLKGVENVARFGALIGALVRQESPQRHEIDFSNPRKPLKSKNDHTKVLIYGGVAAAALVFVLAFGWWTLRSQSLMITQLRMDSANLATQNNGENGKLGVDQVLGEVDAIDQWLLTDINWLEELYQYSSLALTADDVIVDSFEAEINRRTSGVPRIVVNTRAATVNNELELFNSLKQRPFDVKPEGGRTDSRDENYPQANTLRISLMSDPLDRLRGFDEKADEFFRQPKSEPDSSAESADDALQSDDTD